MRITPIRAREDWLAFAFGIVSLVVAGALARYGFYLFASPAAAAGLFAVYNALVDPE